MLDTAKRGGGLTPQWRGRRRRPTVKEPPMRPFLARLSVIVTAVIAALAIGAPGASASLLDGCPDADASQPFLPWGDQSMYVLAPDGGLEHGGDVWDLEDGATVVSGTRASRSAATATRSRSRFPTGATRRRPRPASASTRRRFASSSETTATRTPGSASA